MNIITKTCDKPQDDVYTFNEGIFGFEQLKEFIFINQSEQANSIFRLMISVARPDIGFIVVPPAYIWKNYELEIDDTELSQLGVKNAEDIVVLSIVTLLQDVTKISVNLRSPIILSLSSKQGKQIVLDNNSYEIRHIVKLRQ